MFHEQSEAMAEDQQMTEGLFSFVLKVQRFYKANLNASCTENHVAFNILSFGVESNC